MSACMSGTRGSGVLSSTGDVPVRGAGGACVCVLLGAAWVEKGVSGRENWAWALPILCGQGKCWTCVCVLAAAMWVVQVGSGQEARTRVGSGGVALCPCEPGLSVQMAGPGIRVSCPVDTCTSEVHPVFNPVAP